MMKKIAIMLVLILTVTVCVFSLAGCDEEENDPEQKEFSKFELYHGERYLKEYTYDYTQLYEYDEKYEKYRRVDTNWDDVYTVNTDDLRGYDYLRYYKDGQYYKSDAWNAIFLKGKEYIRAIGETITISMTDMTFDGTLGVIPIEFYDMTVGVANLKFALGDEEEENLFIVNLGNVEVNYCKANEKSDGGFVLD